jgi:hypothetical protein
MKRAVMSVIRPVDFGVLYGAQGELASRHAASKRAFTAPSLVSRRRIGARIWCGELLARREGKAL